MKLIDIALKSELSNSSEKLLLVYLAENANSVGVGRFEECRILDDLKFSDRHLRRLRKALRDRGVLREVGSWYVLLFAYLNHPLTDDDIAVLNGIQLELMSTVHKSIALRG